MAIHFIERQPRCGSDARESRLQRLAVDEFEHKKLQRAGVAAGFLEAIDGPDVGMVQRRKDLRFTREPRDPGRILREMAGQRLEGHVTSEPAVAGSVDLPIPSAVIEVTIS